MEELARGLLLLAASGMDYLLSGWVSYTVLSSVALYYFVVTGPGILDPNPYIGSYGNFVIDVNGTVLKRANQTM